MGGERVVRASDRLGDRACRQTIRLALHQQAENRKPRRLPERSKGRQRMRRGQRVAVRNRSCVSEHPREH